MRKSAIVIPAAILTLLLSNPRQADAQKSYFASFAAEDTEIGVEIDDISKTIRLESNDVIQNNLIKEFAKKAVSKRKLEEIERAIGAINLEIYSLAEKSVSEDKTASSTVKKITKVKVPWWTWEIQNAVKKAAAMQKVWPIKSSAEEYVKIMETEEHHERFYTNSCYILAEAEAAAKLLDEIRISAGTKLAITSGDINGFLDIIKRTWDIEAAIEIGARIKKRFENIEEYKKYDNELKIKRSRIKRLEDVLQGYSINIEKSEKVFEREYNVDLHLQGSDDDNNKKTSSLKIVARKTEGKKNFNLNLCVQTGDFKKEHEYVTDYSFFNESDCRFFIFWPKADQTKVKVLGENVYEGYKEKWVEAVPEGKDKRVELILDASGRALNEAFRLGAKGYIIRTKNLIDFFSKEITNAENESIEDKLSRLSENHDFVEIPKYSVPAESTARRINLSVENAGDFVGLLVKAGIRKGTLQQQPLVGGIEEFVTIYKKNSPIQENADIGEYDYKNEKNFKEKLWNFRSAITIYWGMNTQDHESEYLAKLHSYNEVGKYPENTINAFYPKSIDELFPKYLGKKDFSILKDWINKGVLEYDIKNNPCGFNLYCPQHPKW